MTRASRLIVSPARRGSLCAARRASGDDGERRGARERRGCPRLLVRRRSRGAPPSRPRRHARSTRRRASSSGAAHRRVRVGGIAPDAEASPSHPRAILSPHSQENYKRSGSPRGQGWLRAARGGRGCVRSLRPHARRRRVRRAGRVVGRLPESAVALVLVLDQFSRHVHRHAPDRDARVAAADARRPRHRALRLPRMGPSRPRAPSGCSSHPYRHTQSSVDRLRRPCAR